MSHKSLFSRALAAAPGRLHFAAHSHHLWPDVSFEAQQQAWLDANAHADQKWDLVFGEVIPEAQAHVAAELGLPTTDGLVFSSNTHDFLLRIFSAFERRPVRILATDGEFHSFRRQAQRWEEAGLAVVTRSEKGMTLVGEKRTVIHSPAVALEVFDVSGAGDTAAAGLIAAAAGGLSLPEAVYMANRAAGIVVGKVGTYPVHRDELLKDLLQEELGEWLSVSAVYLPDHYLQLRQVLDVLEGGGE